MTNLFPLLKFVLVIQLADWPVYTPLYAHRRAGRARVRARHCARQLSGGGVEVSRGLSFRIGPTMPEGDFPRTYRKRGEHSKEGFRSYRCGALNLASRVS